MSERYRAIKQELEQESESVQHEVGSLLDKLFDLVGEIDRFDQPRSTRLFAIAVRSKSSGTMNQYVAVTTQLHCKGNHKVENGRFHVHVQTKVQPQGEGWYESKPRQGGRMWWANNVLSQRIDQSIISAVLEARCSLQE